MATNLELIQRTFERQLVSMQGMLPDEYRLTLVARNPKHEGSEIIMTRDDLREVGTLAIRHANQNQPE